MIEKRRKFGRYLVNVMCYGWAFFFVFGRYGIQDYLTLRQELNQLRSSITETEKNIKMTKRAILVWQHDESACERCLREDLYLCGTNELIYRV